MSRQVLGDIKGITTIVAIGNTPYVIRNTDNQIYKWVNGVWDKVSNNSYYNNSRKFSAYKDTLYNLTMYDGNGEHTHIYEKDEKSGNDWTNLVGGIDENCLEIMIMEIAGEKRYIARYNEKIKIFKSGEGWQDIFSEDIHTIDMAIFENKFYFINALDNRVYNCDENWNISEPLPGNFRAIKIEVNKYFVCIIDEKNQVCIHNGSYWEVITDAGFAKDIALSGITIFTLDSEDNRVYKV
ncbi:MAG: hypothetical protein AB8G11_10610 [Saprospiraceae bacterium]